MKPADDRMPAARLFDGPAHGRADRNPWTLARGEESGEGLIEQGGVSEDLLTTVCFPKG
jgi:hypothetical protein